LYEGIFRAKIFLEQYITLASSYDVFRVRRAVLRDPRYALFLRPEISGSDYFFSSSRFFVAAAILACTLKSNPVFFISSIELAWGQCKDQYLRRFSPIFGEKWRVF
jgi:hypothetical protein